MKILKILLVLLIPAMGIVSCKKSECGPKTPNSVAPQPAASNPDGVSGKYSAGTVEGTDDNNPNPIVGSGDDDRDGGDKRKKR